MFELSRRENVEDNVIEQRDENVSDLPVTLVAELDRIHLSLNQIQSIEVGDFIPLNQNFLKVRSGSTNDLNFQVLLVLILE